VDVSEDYVVSIFMVEEETSVKAGGTECFENGGDMFLPNVS
jgi:hypothetical protein